MATWQEMSLDCLRAAQQLYREGRLRSSVNRSYYAAYCALASELVGRGIRFAHGWHNPGHDQLPDLMLNNTSLPRDSRYRLNKAIRILRMAREDADYRPNVSVDRALALDCLRIALRVTDILEIKDEQAKQ